MNAFRLFVWIVGCALVLGGLAYVYQNTRLSADVPFYVAVAGLAVIVGLMFMGLADRVGTRRTVVVERVVDPSLARVEPTESTAVRRVPPSRAERRELKRRERERLRQERAWARHHRPHPSGMTPAVAPSAPASPQAGQPLHQAHETHIVQPTPQGGWSETHIQHERTVDAGPQGQEIREERREVHRKRPAAAKGSRTHRKRTRTYAK